MTHKYLDKIDEILRKLAKRKPYSPKLNGMTIDGYAKDGLTKLVCHVIMNKTYLSNITYDDSNAPFWQRVKQLGTLSIDEEIKILREEDTEI